MFPLELYVSLSCVFEKMLHEIQWIEVLLTQPRQGFCWFLSMGADVWVCGFSQHGYIV